MISRVTLFSLLLGLMLATGIRLSTATQRDACTPYLAGDQRAASSEYVASGTQLISVPCRVWLMRQTPRVQVLCLLDLVLGVVFLLNALSDLREWMEMRRRLRYTG